MRFVARFHFGVLMYEEKDTFTKYDFTIKELNKYLSLISIPSIHVLPVRLEVLC